MRRGNEPVNHEIWDHRMKELCDVLKKRPMNAPELCSFLAKARKWPSLYTINVIAAADIAGLIRTMDDKWTSVEL